MRRAGKLKSSSIGSGLSAPGQVTGLAFSSTTFSGSISGTTLTVNGTVIKWFGVGGKISGGGVTAGTVITANGTGSGQSGTYTVNNSQSVSGTFTLTYGQLSNAAYLVWTAPSGNPTSYTLEASLAGANTWSIVQAGILPTSYANGQVVLRGFITGLAASTAYDYRCTAVNGFGAGTPSAIISDTTLALTGIPSTPVVTTTVISSYAVYVTWAASTNSPNGYVVEWSPTGANTWTEEAISGVTNFLNRLVWFPASPGTTFDFRVKATNLNGTSAAYSSVVSGATLARLAVTNAPTVSSYGWTGDDQTVEDPLVAAAYAGGTAYVPGTVVSNAGVFYMAITETTGNAPPNATYWNPIATTVYYFSNAGSDAAAGTSPATAFQTMDRLSNLITSGNYAAPGPAPNNTLCLFRRGDTFDGPILVQANNKFMFGSYGTGTNAMPKIKWTTYIGGYQANRLGTLSLIASGCSVICKHLNLIFDRVLNTSPSAGYVVNIPSGGSTVVGNLNLHSCELSGAKITGIRGDSQFNWNIKNCYIHNNKTGFNGLESFNANWINNTWDDNGAPTAVFNGTISGTTLTVNSITYGAFEPGMGVTGAGVTANTSITAYLTGTGGTGTYTVNNSQTIGPLAMTGGDNTFDHSLYFSTGARTVIRGNLFASTAGFYGNYGLNLHGAVSDMIIDQNKFSGCQNAIGLSNGYVANISLGPPKEYFAGCQFTRNIVENSGIGVGQGQGFGMLMDSIVDCIFWNNAYRNNKFTDITVSYSADPPDDLPCSNNIFSNNSFVSTTTTSSCISVSSASTLGTVFKNNAMYLTSSGAFAVTVASGVLAAEVTLDHNQYYDASGATTHLFSWLGVNYANLALFKAAVSGKETGSAQGNPNFANTTGNFAISGAPCRSNGSPVSGLTIDFAGTARSGSTPSIGAYE
jgi:hypothetical protein